MDDDGIWAEDIRNIAYALEVVDTHEDERGTKYLAEAPFGKTSMLRLAVAWCRESNMIQVITVYVRHHKRRRTSR